MVPWSKNSDDVIEPYDEDQKSTNGNSDIPRVVQQEERRPVSPQPVKGPEAFGLGSYKTAVAPLSVLLFAYICGTIAIYRLKPDPRVKDWWLMSGSLPTLSLCVLYVLSSTVWGPRLMKNVNPFGLKKLMIAYNAFQIVLSAYIFYEVGMSGWFFDYRFTCQTCDYSMDPQALRMANIAWYYYFSKIIDFVDTLFFVLNKKWSHISLLHVVHHSSMCMSVWFGILVSPGGHVTFMGYLNSAVHTIMYTYYLLSLLGPALKPYLWWKKYLTTIQLVQFVAVFIHAAQLFVIDCPSVPKGLAVWTCIYAFIFFALFIDFYKKAYLQAPKKLKVSSPGRRRRQIKETVNYIREDVCNGRALKSRSSAKNSFNQAALNMRLATTCLGDTNSL